MARKYKITNQQAIYFTTFTVVNWVDLFIRDIYKEIFTNNVKFCQNNKGLEVYAWCIMTSHIHMILGKNGVLNLEDIIRDLKSYSSRIIRKELENSLSESRREWMLNLFYKRGILNKRNKDFQLWDQYNHPVELSTNEMMDQRLDYTHYNPVVAGFVQSPEDWIWSSARDYCGRGKGKLSIKFIE
jgi:REP element-mobilizing transposase RayT